MPNQHSRHYVWWFPGSPVKVHVDLSVIDSLHGRLRGASEQGLLFGTVRRGAIEISEYQPVSASDVPEAIAALPPDSPTRCLIGYYRTEHGEALRLNADDLCLFKTHFGKPYHLFLLIQPNAFAPANATFFFSRGGRKISEYAFLEFPLDSSLLAVEERPIEVKHPAPTGTVKRRAARNSLLEMAAGTMVAAFLLFAVSSKR
jgi:hypothetical protein